MAGYFLDTSAIVKRYVQETGTPWIRELTRRGTTDPIYLAGITTVELTSAVARRRQGGSLSTSRVGSILARFQTHAARRYVVIDVTTALLATAANLADSHALRAYDAVQLAAALEVNRRSHAAGRGYITLISADKELNAAAAGEGLAVGDPNAHP